MKKALVCMLILAMCMIGLAAGETAEQPMLQQDVLVLFTSDVHCGVDQGFGYVGLKAVKDAAATATPCLTEVPCCRNPASWIFRC